jgi:hypothetical protein
MYQMKIDVEQRAPVGVLAHNMLIPEFLEECFCWHQILNRGTGAPACVADHKDTAQGGCAIVGIRLSSSVHRHAGAPSIHQLIYTAW